MGGSAKATKGAPKKEKKKVPAVIAAHGLLVATPGLEKYVAQEAARLATRKAALAAGRTNAARAVVESPEHAAEGEALREAASPLLTLSCEVPFSTGGVTQGAEVSGEGAAAPTPADAAADALTLQGVSGGSAQHVPLPRATAARHDLVVGPRSPPHRPATCERISCAHRAVRQLLPLGTLVHIDYLHIKYASGRVAECIIHALVHTEPTPARARDPQLRSWLPPAASRAQANCA